MVKPIKTQVHTHQKVLSNNNEQDHEHEHEHEHEHGHDHEHFHHHGHAHGHDHDHDHHDHGNAHHVEDTLVDKPVRFQEYELLEKRNKRKETDNPEAKEYFKARELFIKGFEIASKIPDKSEDETLKAHEDKILESTNYLVESFLIDDNATEMSPRIMSLAQQYEKLIKLTYDGTESEKNAVELEINDAKLGDKIKTKKDNSAQDDPDHLTRESLILVIWLLFNGKQYPFCIQTLTIALNQLEPKLHPRLYHLRALCYLVTEDLKNCIKDLERLLAIDHNFVDAYCIQGFVYMSQGDRLDRLEAARNFKTYTEKASKDSISYSHALYALAALTCQNATSLTGSRNQVSQNLRYQQAYNYYQKAKEAENRYEYLYGHTPDMVNAKRIAFIPEISDVKHTAMAIFEHKSKEATKVEKDSKKEAEKLAILQQFLTSFPNGEQQKKCNSCGSQTRKDLNGELDAEQKSKLLICARCSNVNYCSKECQKKDWKNGHKQACVTAKTG